MSLKCVAWLVDDETEHARVTLGPAYPGGAYAQALVTMFDAQNAVAVERERWEKALRTLRDAVVSQNRYGASWDERVFGPMMGGLALAAELLDGPNE